MAIIVSLDIGTSKLCALALDAKTNKILAISSIPNGTDIKNLPPHLHEQDPRQIIHGCFQLIKDLLTNIDAEDVAGIGISGQMHGVLLVNEHLEPQTNLITWRDQRTVDDIKALQLDTSVFEHTGCRLSSGYGGATLSWLNTNNKIMSNSRALTIADYLAANLTGIMATEATHAASWGIFDVKNNCWHKPIISLLNIPEFVLPQVLATAKSIGNISAKQAEFLGLPKNTQVCAPIGDNQASVIGAAGLAANSAVVNLGTGGQISIPISRYAYSNQLETRPMPFKGYIQVGASLCGGWSHAYLKDFFYNVIKDVAGIEVNSETIYKKINALAIQAGHGAAGLIADTRFSGTRLDPAARGAISNITRDNLTPHNVCRAFIEGMVHELFEFSRNTDLTNVRKLVASGNAVRKNTVVKEVLSRIFNMPCQIGATIEEAATGAAYAAAFGLRLTSK